MATPGSVLFACGYNRVRSPMAEGLMKRLAGDRVFIDSCGLKPADEESIDPFVVEVMAEIGIDASRHRPKTFDQLQDESFDVVVSLTPEAQHRAVELTRGAAVALEYWPTPDPTLTTGSREAILQAYREVRDGLAARIQERFGDAGGVGESPGAVDAPPRAAL